MTKLAVSWIVTTMLLAAGCTAAGRGADRVRVLTEVVGDSQMELFRAALKNWNSRGPVVFEPFGPQRLERGQPDVEGHPGGFDSPPSQPLKHFGSEMKPGRRSGNRPVVFGVKRLIAGQVLRPARLVVSRPLNIRRKRGVSDLFKMSQDVRNVEAEDAMPVVPRGDDFGRQGRGEIHPVPRPDLPGRAA